MTTQKLPLIGATLENGVVSAIVPNLAGNGYDALIVLVDDQGKPIITDEMKWGAYGEEIEGAASDVDGKANTDAMVAAGNELAKKVAETGGYLPSQRELQAIYASNKDAVPADWYWSSTQFSAGYAWIQDFGSGDAYTWSKGLINRAFAVRRAPIL